jgi:hypothetical protein
MWIDSSAAEILDEPGDVHAAEPLQCSGRARSADVTRA